MTLTRGKILAMAAAVLALGLLSGSVMWLADHGTVVGGVRVWGENAGRKSGRGLVARLSRRADAWENETMELRAAGRTWKVARKDLGLGLDTKGMASAARAIGNRGPWWNRVIERLDAHQGRYRVRPLVLVDRRRFLSKLDDIKKTIDRPAKRTRFDFRRKAVIAGHRGVFLDKYQSAAAILDAAVTGKTALDLPVHWTGNRTVGKIEISTILGWYETPFKSRGKWAHRAHNLKIAARKLNGHIIWPGQVFSFNETVGPRTAKEGYRVAPVISRGEMVDGMAGGACQISSTLYAAAFFAGLDLVEADVHSQPSHYIELGLDATVVWPDKDLKLKNPFPFPVVLHYEVAFGRVRTEILGPSRPYHKIGFERRIVRSKPYKEISRPDPTMLQGTRSIEQRGEFGYTVRRRRVFFDAQNVEVKAQYWTVTYPPTTLIVRVGTKPPQDPTQPVEELKPVPPKPMPKRFVRIVQ